MTESTEVEESVEALQLPVLISDSMILNAVVRGVERLAEELGPEYHVAVTQKYFDKTLVLSKSEPIGDLELDLRQTVGSPQENLWSIELEPRLLEADKNKNANNLFYDRTIKYFFLTEEEALGYLEEVSQHVMDFIKQSLAQKEA